MQECLIHIYNSTSTLQRDVVFNMDREEIKQIAVDGTKMVKKYMEGFDGNIQLQYSPEALQVQSLILRWISVRQSRKYGSRLWRIRSSSICLQQLR